MPPILIKGGSFTDDRGTLEYVNQDNPGCYRRFYLITHPNTDVVRAWQGHKQEEKTFYVIKGSFIIATVRPKDFDSPDENETPELFHLHSAEKHLLRVPGGYYNGIKALEPNSTILVFSSFSINESKKDDYRQPPEKWLDWKNIH